MKFIELKVDYDTKFTVCARAGRYRQGVRGKVNRSGRVSLKILIKAREMVRESLIMLNKKGETLKPGRCTQKRYGPRW